jgi:hypothetical protein
MNAFATLSKIEDCSIAMDGGSIGIALSDERGTITHFIINRSVTAIGTAEFNQVTGASGRLDGDAQKLLRTALERILGKTNPNDPCFDLVTKFAGKLGDANSA